MKAQSLFLACLVGMIFAATAKAQNAELQAAINTIKAVDVDGQGHDEAIKAVAILNNATAADVPAMLQGMQGANKLALNWLRGSIQSALNKGPMPRQEIEAYLNNQSGSHMGRLMAFELLSEADDSFAENNVSRMLEDPSLPLRQLAVADFIKKAEEAEEAADAIGMLAHALPHAREVGQIVSIARMLDERGIKINVQAQLGVIPNWHIVGKFDHTKEQGFDKAMGPEKDPANVDLEASYDDSKTGDAVTWQSYNTLDPTGAVDLNELLGEEKGVIAYACMEFNAAEDQDVDIRIGCINGNKVWVNGEEILNNEIYHVGMMTDQFIGKAKLKKGVNQILIKVCQNEQTQPWANLWSFQLRVCEADGKAVLPMKPTPQRQ